MRRWFIENAKTSCILCNILHLYICSNIWRNARTISYRNAGTMFVKAEEHEISIVAYDLGTPSLSTSISINVIVQVNKTCCNFQNILKTYIFFLCMDCHLMFFFFIIKFIYKTFPGTYINAVCSWMRPWIQLQSIVQVWGVYQWQYILLDYVPKPFADSWWNQRFCRENWNWIKAITIHTQSQTICHRVLSMLR